MKQKPTPNCPISCASLAASAVSRLEELARTRLGDGPEARGSTLRFVILNGLASAEILAAPDESLLRAAYAAVAR